MLALFAATLWTDDELKASQWLGACAGLAGRGEAAICFGYPARTACGDGRITATTITSSTLSRLSPASRPPRASISARPRPAVWAAPRTLPAISGVMTTRGGWAKWLAAGHQRAGHLPIARRCP